MGINLKMSSQNLKEEDKEITVEVLNLKALKIMSKYSGIPLEEKRKLAEFCFDLTNKLMKEEMEEFFNEI